MIDARMLLGRFSGVGRVVTKLIDELVKQDDIEVTALCGSEVFVPWVGRREFRVIQSSFGRGDRTAGRRLSWEERHLRGLIRRAEVDVYHATWNTGVPGRCPVPAVLTIHDLIPWLEPASHFAGVIDRWSHRLAVRSSAKRAACITTVSDHVRDQVLAMMAVEPDRVVTVPNGVDPPLCEPALPRPTVSYALYVGGHEPRKNVAGVLRAMGRYWETADADDSGPPMLALRLTGHAGSLSSGAAAVYRELPDRSRIYFLGNLDDEALGEAYANASVLLMLSHDEGFGLPVLEAMAYGCPVVAASRASLPEVVGDAGVLVCPDDADAVSEAVRQIVTKPGYRAELVARGKARARASSWKSAAGCMRECYERVLRPTVRENPLPVGA
jgi:glycosyltransferase involved in cell wall biosynthesis